MIRRLSSLVALLAALPASAQPDGAAAARQQLVEEAASLLDHRQPDRKPEPRPWHELSWLYAGPGMVGRLHDVCTGAVEPKPRLEIGAWTPETVDPRALSEADRTRLKAWYSQAIVGQWLCGAMFQIGDLGHEARGRVGSCPELKQGPQGAFTRYVAQRPELRARDDALEVTVEALRAEGCAPKP